MLRGKAKLLAVVAFVLVLLLSPLLESMASGGGAPKRGPHAVRYAPGAMERVAVVRGMPWVPRMASVPDCGRVGEWVTAWINGHLDTYRVTDCSHPRDRARHIRQGLVIEVDHRSASLYFPKGQGWAPNARIVGYSARYPARRAVER